jgi:plasmid stabilization system protein ParE
LTRAELDDIEAQASFIARDDRAAALQVADRLRETAAALARSSRATHYILLSSLTPLESSVCPYVLPMFYRESRY